VCGQMRARWVFGRKSYGMWLILLGVVVEALKMSAVACQVVD
jgi:hypothetical protein